MKLGNRNLTQSVAAFWAEHFDGTIETIYPGMQQDATDWEKWVELQLPLLREEPRSSAGLAMVRFSLDVHCFARQGPDLKRMPKLLDSVRNLLTRAVFVVRNHEESARPAIGLARFGEAEVRDLSRIEQRVLGGTLNHWLVIYRGLAQITEGED